MQPEPCAIWIPELTSFAPSAFCPETFAAGAVIAVFFFWGWDVPLNASEETRTRRRNAPALVTGARALACAWHFRRTRGMFLLAVAWPLVSALALWAAAALAARQMDATTLVAGLGGLALGLIPPACARSRPAQVTTP